MSQPAHCTLYQLSDMRSNCLIHKTTTTTVTIVTTWGHAYLRGHLRVTLDELPRKHAIARVIDVARLVDIRWGGSGSQGGIGGRHTKGLSGSGSRCRSRSRRGAARGNDGPLVIGDVHLRHDFPDTKGASDGAKGKWQENENENENEEQSLSSPVLVSVLDAAAQRK